MFLFSIEEDTILFNRIDLMLKWWVPCPPLYAFQWLCVGISCQFGFLYKKSFGFQWSVKRCSDESRFCPFRIVFSMMFLGCAYISFLYAIYVPKCNFSRKREGPPSEVFGYSLPAACSSISKVLRNRGKLMPKVLALAEPRRSRPLFANHGHPERSYSILSPPARKAALAAENSDNACFTQGAPVSFQSLLRA